MRRQFAGAAFSSVLTAELTASVASLTINCDDLTNWPDGTVGPFYVVIDRGLPNEEKILCVSRSGNVLSVYNSGMVNGRGADDTSVTYHGANAVIEHVFTATDADEANLHVNTPSLHITVCTSTTRPAAPVANQTILETDTRMMFTWDGSTWQPVVSIASGGYTDLFLMMGA